MEAQDPHSRIDALIERAHMLLGFMGDHEAAKVMMESGKVGGEAYLAIMAAKILDATEDRQ